MRRRRGRSKNTRMDPVMGKKKKRRRKEAPVKEERKKQDIAEEDCEAQ